MWRCPYCDTEMLRTSRPGHLKNKAGCKEEHAKHLAKEAEKQEELKAKRMALFRSSAAAPGQSESDAGPAEAPPSKGANLGKQGALNSNLGSVSGVMESMVNYLDGKFAEIHKKLELQDSQMKQIEYKVGSELKQIKQQLGKQQEKQQQPAPKPLPASFREAKTPEDLLVCFPRR